MPAGIQKNVRLPGRAAEVLRALKYDLDASDGEVVARALEVQAVERLRHHAAVFRRAELGLIPRASAGRSRAGVVALLAALNWEQERYRVEDGRLMVDDDGSWHPGPAGYGEAVRSVCERAVELARQARLAEVTPAVLLLACCESRGAGRFSALGVAAAELAAALRRALQRRTVAQAPRAIPFNLAAKAVLMEGCSGLAGLDGIGGAGVEHVLVAALQSDDGDVAAARGTLGIDADRARALLLG